MYVADVAQILCGCVYGYGEGPAAAAPTGPLAWELPYAVAVALKREREKKMMCNLCVLRHNFQTVA